MHNCTSEEVYKCTRPRHNDEYNSNNDIKGGLPRVLRWDRWGEELDLEMANKQPGP